MGGGRFGVAILAVLGKMLVKTCANPATCSSSARGLGLSVPCRSGRPRGDVDEFRGALQSLCRICASCIGSGICPSRTGAGKLRPKNKRSQEK